MNFSVSLRSRACALLYAFCIAPFVSALAQPLPERVPLLGKVTTTAGTPIGGAQVTVRRQDATPNFTAAFWGGVVRTDANGVFSFPEAEEGIYYVLMDAPGFASDATTLTWKPESSSMQVKLLKLTPLPLRVFDKDGKPLVGTNVQLYLRAEPPGRSSFPALVTSGEGTIVVPDLVPARYWIHAVVPGKGYAILPAFNVQENATPQTDVLLRPGGRVRAIARSADGKPIGGAALSLSQNVPGDAPASSGGIPAGNDGAIYLYTQGRSTLITRDGDGAMELADVAPGRYQARLFLPGETNPALQTVEVKAGETAEVTASFAALNTKASLELSVQTADGKPAANRDFVVRFQSLVNGQPVPLGENGPPMPPEAPQSVLTLFQGVLLRRFHTDGNGKATLFPLRPGSWRLTLIDPTKNREEPQDQSTGDVNLGAQSTNLTMKLKQ